MRNRKNKHIEKGRNTLQSWEQNVSNEIQADLGDTAGSVPNHHTKAKYHRRASRVNFSVSQSI